MMPAKAIPVQGMNAEQPPMMMVQQPGVVQGQVIMQAPVQGQVIMQAPVQGQVVMAQPQVVQQPIMMAPMQTQIAPIGVAGPSGAPPGGFRRSVRYCGPLSLAISIVGSVVCGVPLCLCVPCCPCDRRDFYVVGQPGLETYHDPNSGRQVSKPCLARFAQ